MSKIIIYTSNSFALRVIFETIDDVALESIRQGLKDGMYTASEPIEVPYEGEQAAEEAFDLTNNPGRQDERELKYGRGPSVSTGDVIDVDGTLYLCLSVGWKKL